MKTPAQAAFDDISSIPVPANPAQACASAYERVLIQNEDDALVSSLERLQRSGRLGFLRS